MFMCLSQYCADQERVISGRDGRSRFMEMENGCIKLACTQHKHYSAKDTGALVEKFQKLDDYSPFSIPLIVCFTTLVIEVYSHTAIHSRFTT